MSNINMRGSLPLLILQELSRGPNHGYQIAKEIKEKSDGVLDFAEGTLYPTLHDLKKQNLIEQTEKEGRRRNYRITENGRKILEAQREEWKQYSISINRILGETS